MKNQRTNRFHTFDAMLFNQLIKHVENPCGVFDLFQQAQRAAFSSLIVASPRHVGELDKHCRHVWMIVHLQQIYKGSMSTRKNNGHTSAQRFLSPSAKACRSARSLPSKPQPLLRLVAPVVSVRLQGRLKVAATSYDSARRVSAGVAINKSEQARMQVKPGESMNCASLGCESLLVCDRTR